jgi:hypothetical protein
MIYTNNDIDRKQRQKHYLIRVYVFPALLVLFCCLVIYSLTNYLNLNSTDKELGYIISIAIGLIVWFKNKFKWLPLPDGTHYYVTNDKNDTTLKLKNASYINEPSEYEAIFGNSKADSGITFIIGIITVCFGLYIMPKSSLFLPLLVIAGGLFLLVDGFKKFFDTSPKLKLSKQGLWTLKLGFHNWTSIKDVRVIKESDYRTKQTYLEIFLINGAFKGIDYPDERLSLFGIEDNNKIESLIKELKHK